ncbi:MAG: efflux RND transporter periplasmic adaptor subunit [Leptolyngbyaceae cyanobacterium]
MTQLQDSDAMASSNSSEAFNGRTLTPYGAGYTKLLIGIGLGMAIALIGSRLLTSSPDSTDEPLAPETTQVSAQTVTVVPVGTGQVADSLPVTGTVQAADLLAVTPQISGLQIQEVLVEAGDRVNAGQLLVILDDTELRAQIQRAEADIQQAEAQIQQAEAQIAEAQANRQQEAANVAQSRALLAEAEANLERYQSLADQGAVSAEERDSRLTQAATARESVSVAEANLNGAEANVTSAEANLASAAATVRSRQSELARLQTQFNFTTVSAPTDGIVAERPASVGSVSSTSSEVVTLIQNNQLELVAEVTQAQLPQVQVGAPVIVTSSTDPDIRVEGTVQEIKPLVDPQTRTAEVLIGLPASERLRSGIFLTADIQAGQRSGLTIPAPALLAQPDGSTRVYVLSPEGTAVSRTVQVGTRLDSTDDDPARVEILQGLEPGEQVIVAGASYLQEGDVVTVAEE